jgi:hypothetical protein
MKDGDHGNGVGPNVPRTGASRVQCMNRAGKDKGPLAGPFAYLLYPGGDGIPIRESRWRVKPMYQCTR